MHKIKVNANLETNVLWNTEVYELSTADVGCSGCTKKNLTYR